MKGEIMGKVIKNYLYNISYQILVIVLPLVTLPYASRVLGPSSIGIGGVVDSFVAIFLSLGMLGTNMYAHREIAYCGNNKEKIAQTFYEILILRFVLLLITIAIFIGATWKSEYNVYYKIQVLLIVGNFLDVSWLYIGLEKIKPVVIRNYIIKIIATIAIFVFVKEKNDLDIYMYINCGSVFISGFLMYPMAINYVRGCKVKKINCWRHIVPSVALFLPQAASQVYLQLDKLMIEALTGNTVEIGYYTQNEKLVKVPIVLASALTTVLMPRIANEFSQGNYRKIKGYVENAIEWILFIEIPCMFGMLGIAQNMVGVVLGEEFANSYGVLMIMVPLILPISLSNVTGAQFLLATNKTIQMTVSYISGALIDVIINSLLIPKIGVYGAAIGTIAAEYLVFGIQYCFVRKEIGKIQILKPQIKCLVSGAIMAICVWLIGTIPMAQILKLFLQVLCGVIIYVVLLIILKDRRVINFIQDRMFNSRS